MNKLFTLFTLLLLLPLAARAAAPTTLTVGGTNVQSGGYWTTDESGTLPPDGASADNYNVYYDGNGTLTLKDATITGEASTNFGAGIYVEGDLTIMLIDSSTITGVQPSLNANSGGLIVRNGNLTVIGDGSLTVNAADGKESNRSYAIQVDYDMTQQGGSITCNGGKGSFSFGMYLNGKLTVYQGSMTACGGTATNTSYGIYIEAIDASVTVSDATVTATSGTGNNSYGLHIQSSSPSVTLSGGSLTARSGSATNTAGGIYFQNPFGSTGSVTVGDNSTLLANSVILHDNSFIEKPLAPTGNGSWLIYGQSNQPSVVGGTYTLTDDLTIENGNTFTIPAGSTLTVPQGKTLTVNGTLNIANQSSLTGSGSLAGSGAFNLTNPDPVISGSDTLTYDGTNQFSKFTLTAPSGTVDVMGKAFNISDSTSTDGWNRVEKEIINAGDYTLTAKNGTRTIEKEVTVSPATISITSATVQDKIYNGTTDATVTGVTFNGLVEGDSLISGTDYTATATFADKSAGENKTATVTVTLTNGNYTFSSNGNTATATAKISPLAVALSWSTPTSFTYDGQPHSVTASITNAVSGDTFNLTYTDNTATAVNSYTATVTGLGNANYTLTGASGTEQAWSIVEASIANATVELSGGPFTYTGTEQQPTVTVKLGDKILTENTDYTVDYSDKSINAGEYTVTVTGTGNYSGTVTATYTITPAALTITGATLASKTYDGTTNATVESVTFNGLVNSESLTLNTDYTATAVFDDANAGRDKSATVTVTLSNGNYSLATSTYTLADQTIDQAVFDGTTEISGSVLANCSDEVKLPDIPDGASYGTPTSNDVTDMSITDGVLHYTGGSGVTSEETYTITVPVTGATNYVDYTITVTLTGKEIVTVKAEGSKNPSFSTSQDRFTLTATVSGENLSENPDCWTWDIADKTVADFIDSPTTRSMSVSDSRTFEIKGPGTTTITATYDDGKYHGSVIFSVSISKPTTPDPQPAIYNIYVEDVCDGVEVSTSKQAVKEGGSIIVYVEKDTAHYTFDNFHVYYKEGYYGPWVELPEGVQPGEYPIKNIWNHIYIKAEGAEEKEDPTGIEQIEGVKVYTKDGSLYVQTPQREQVIIVSMSGAVVKNEEQIGLKQYHGLHPGIYIVRVGQTTYKLRLH